MRRFLSFLTLLLAVSGTSCTRAASPPAGAADELAVVGAAAPAAETQAAAPSLQSIWAEQKLIRSAELDLEVDSVAQAVRNADGVAHRFDALLADTRVSQDDDGRHSAVLVIRTPAERFAAVLDGLRALGRVRSDIVTTEDVTKAYADLETRLAVKEETATRLRRLLADRTGDLSDVLEVERELSRVVTEIEQMKGERRYYDQRVAVSTITVTLREPGALLRPGASAPLKEAFSRSLEVLSTSLAWLIYIVVFVAPWVAVAGVAWWLVRLVRRRRRGA